MRTDLTTRLGTGAILLSFFGLVAILWASDALVFTGTESSAKVVTAYLTLVGAFLAAIVSFVGLLLKHAIDDRTEARVAAENKRNEILERESEDRLKLEAAIRAIQLLSGQNGAPSLQIQRAGALTTLSNLGQHGLTLALVTELLQDDELNPTTASYILDRALRCDDRVVQRDAVVLFKNFARKFLTPHGAELPGIFITEAHRQTPYVRSWLSIAIARLFVARSIVEWRTSAWTTVGGLVGILCSLWRKKQTRCYVLIKGQS